MVTSLDLDTLIEFAKKGTACQAAVDALLSKARKCPHCGDIFLPQSWNAKFCSYRCRYLLREKLKRKLR